MQILNRDNKKPKVAILGAGAIGQLLFHQFAKANKAPYVIGRSAHAATAVNSSNMATLHYTDISGEQLDRQAQVILPESQQLVEIDLLIVCVKAYQVFDALVSLIPKLHSHCHLLLLHNGMGPHLEIAKLLNGRGLSLGTTSQGALRPKQWHIIQTGTGLTQLGHYCGPMMSVQLKQQLLDSIPNSQWCEPILPMLWQKLAVNIAINPLTAIYNCRNGELAKPQYRNEICALLNEVFTVADAEGLTLDRPALTQRVFDVIHLTANNHSSMHQDIYHQRKTEIDAINGYLIIRAKHHGIDTPCNTKVYRQIITLQNHG
ncbi:2-dehydropantoate 2-reductase [Shewanella mesophila]|uniref:ketopantoate reductase family protein n=1 Tax=Shewanella mesophila TaxID=2864208 RepID=UPI001C65DFAD|nr:2-dehydropantoate 2-reductase [Shewanella mesophila]QYJ87092.1 2-dehydropantoate 2-reductase [Shewanella mesophila]